ncbi:MAG: ABC transporter substrate-binding protein [Pseudanabaenaceae cyanobacterium bins.68]|nr:ABC transporter substrate-binding protein [Pseudanabaenaceae cyanobacterium bins.68]
MLKRFLSLALLFALALGLTLGLSNCTNQSLNTSQTSDSKEFTIWWNEGYFPEETEAIRKIVGDWEKASGKKANLTIYSEKDLAREVNNAIANNVTPDVLYSYSADFNLIPRLAWDGKLADVSDVIEPIKDVFLPSALSAVSYQNNLTQKRGYFAIPIAQQANHIHYWQDLLKQQGLTKADIPKDWNRFWQFWQALQAKARANQDTKQIYGLGMPMSNTATDTFFQFEYFLEAYGLKLLDQQGQLQLDQPQVRQGIVAALKQYADLYKTGFVPPKAVEWGDPDNNVSFLSRGVLMSANPSLSIPVSQKQDQEIYLNKIATVGFPNKLSGAPMDYKVALKQAVIFESSTQKQAAKEFLTYLTKPENLGAYIQGSQARFFPVMPKLLDDPFWKKSKDPHISVAIQQFSRALPFPHTLNPAYSQVQLQNVWGAAIQSIARSEASPEQAAETAIAKIKQIFADWK